MRGRGEERIEAAVDSVAAALFGAAVSCSIFLLFQNAVAAIGAGVIGALLAVALLRRVQAIAPRFEIAVFRVSDLELASADELLLTELAELLLTEQVELVLTDSDRLRPATRDESELVLDDILAELGPDSRVVRLFDPSAMPTPGQLNARIERHLRDGQEPAAPADASNALHEALAELRRSLR